MTNPEYDATWIKALAFINRAVDDADEFEERAFWAVCSLKLLAKAAVIARQPLSPGRSSPPESARRDNVFRRCQSMTSRFDALSANGIEASRSRYLDSGDAFCSSITPSQWWERYWPLVDVLLGLHGRQLADLVGADREPGIKQILRRSTESVAARVADLMNEATDVCHKRRRGELTADECHAIVARTQTHHSLAAQQKCPVCGSDGSLRGDTALAVDTSRDLAIAAEAFVCSTCGLILRGPDAIRGAGLPESFTHAPLA